MTRTMTRGITIYLLCSAVAVFAAACGSDETTLTTAGTGAVGTAGNVGTGGAVPTGGLPTGGVATGGVATGGVATGGITTGGVVAGGGAAGEVATGGTSGDGSGGDAAGEGAAGEVATGGTSGDGNGGSGTGGQPPVGPIPGFAPVGFASMDEWGQNGTTGGYGGETVTVTTSAELLDYMSREGPYIIQVEGMISVGAGMHEVTSDKTIIGLGANAGITGGGLNVGLPIDNAVLELPPNAVHNVIICNLTFDGANDDNINVMMFSHHIWIHHNTFTGSGDGALDYKRGSSYGTISYNHFVSTRKTMLLAHSDENDAQDVGRLKVSYHHNWFDHGRSRHPRCRYGETHIFNNFYENISNYGIGVGKKSRIYSENNYCEGGNCSRGVSNSGSGGMKDVGSVGGFSSLNPDVITWNPSEYYSYTPDPAESVPEIVKANAGVGKMAPMPTP